MAETRLKGVLAECKSVMELCNETNSPFKEFEVDTDDGGVGLHFSVNCNGEKKSYTIQFTSDYPSGTVLLNRDNYEMKSVESMTVIQILESIRTFVGSPFAQPSTSQSSQASTSASSVDLDPVEQLSDDEFDDVYLNAKSPQNNNEVDISAELQLDLTNFKEIFGPDSMIWRHLESLQTIDIQIKIVCDHLIIPERAAEAWGIKLDEPLTLVLKDIDPVNYRNAFRVADLKQFSLFYETDPQNHLDFLVRKQLLMVVHNFFKRSWIRGRPQAGVDVRNDNFWIELRDLVLDRLPTLSGHCVICDKKQLCEDLFLPSVCEDPLCVFGYETLGITSSSACHLRSEKDMKVVDLLMAMLGPAAFSSRREQIFLPFPSIVDPNDPANLALSPIQKDFSKLYQIVANLPCPTAMRTLVEGLREEDIRGKMDEVAGSLAFPLIRWVLSSNRTYVVPLDKDELLAFMPTSHQFLMLLDSPAKEAEFKAAKQAAGGKSVFAFHGSPAENWHSILRRGLINASGTDMMINGAAFGSGIYLSPLLSVSLAYCCGRSASAELSGFARCPMKKHSRGHSCPPQGGDILDPRRHVYFMAICEVIDSPQLARQDNSKNTWSASVWVAKNPAHVCTRMLFAFDGTPMKDGQVVDLRQPTHLAAIQSLVDAKKL